MFTTNNHTMKQQTTLIHLSKIEHRGQIRIKVLFPKNQLLIDKIKTIEGRKWSQSKNCWHVPYSEKSFKALKDLFGNNIQIPSQKNIKKENPPGAIIPNLNEYIYKDEVRKRFVGKKILIQQLDKHSIAVYIPYDKRNWVDIVREMNGRKWNTEMTCWELPYVKSSFRHIKKHIGLEHVILDLSIEKDISEEPSGGILLKKKMTKKKEVVKHPLSSEQKKALALLEEYFILKQYSYSTIKAYSTNLKALFIFYDKVSPTQLSSDHLRTYLLHLIKFKKIAASTQNQIINAYKAYAEKILGQPKMIIEIPRPKKPKQMPNVLSQKEVKKLLSTPTNLKHKLILVLIYSSGLRLSEVINLRKTDIQLERMNMHIKSGKGKKDRMVALARQAIPLIDEYLKSYSPSYWLFEGNTGGQYSARSVQSIFYRTLEASKVNAYATVHTLRHSFATHCIENGYSVALVQHALGHDSIKTTERYLHLSNKEIKKLKSPLDDFDL